MKIAIIIRKYGNIFYETIDIHGEALASELRKQGHEVTILYLMKDNDFPGDNFHLPVHKALFRKFDVIYGSSPRRYHGLLCLLFSFIKLNPFYFSVFDAKIEPITENKLGKVIFKILYKLKMVRPFAMSETQKKYFFLKLGIDLPVLKPCLIKFNQNFGKKFVKSGQPSILFGGSFNDEKRGLGDLLEALVVIKKKYPEVKLIALNKYNYFADPQNKFIKMAKSLGLDSNVEFKGLIPNIDEEYSRAWVYTLPFNDFEYCPPLPFTIMEAMSFGCQIVSTQFDYLRDILPEDCLIPKSRPDLLAAKIMEKFAEPQDSSELLKEFIPEKIAEIFLSLVKR